MSQDNDWRANLLTDIEDVRRVLIEADRVAVLGIKPESRSSAPAHYVPAYMQSRGYDIIPVPVYYPEVTEILGAPVVRDLRALPHGLDVLNVFRRSEDVPAHLEDILAIRPRVVWLQQGIRHDEVAQTLARAGIEVIQDRCMLADHRAAL